MTSLALLLVLVLMACCAIVPGGGQDIESNLKPVNQNNELAEKALWWAVGEIDSKDGSRFWRLARKTGGIKGATIFKFSGIQLALTSCSKRIPYFDVNVNSCRFKKADMITCSFKVIQPLSGKYGDYKYRDINCMHPVYAPNPNSSDD